MPLEEVSHAHRHDFHFFIILEKGIATFEVDFKKYKISKTDYKTSSAKQKWQQKIMNTTTPEFLL